MKKEIKGNNNIINKYAKIINRTKKECRKLRAENIKYRNKLKRQKEHDKQEHERQMREKEMNKKQRDKWYIRRPKKQEVKKYCYYSESKIESEHEAF